MYGDMRHIFVLQSELENEVDFEDIKHSADKYSKAFNSHNQRQMKAKKITVDRKNYRSDTEPYFRPARPSAVNSKQKTKPPKVTSSEQQENTALLDNLIKTNIDAIVVEAKLKEEISTTPEAARKTTKLTTVPSSSSTTQASISHAKDETTDNESAAELSFTIDDAIVVERVITDLYNNVSSTTLASLKASSVQLPVEEESTEKLSSTLRNELINSNDLKAVEEELEAEILNDLEQVGSSDGEIFAESDAIDRHSSKEPQTTTTETQLFQDMVQKEKEPTPVVNRRGM